MAPLDPDPDETTRRDVELVHRLGRIGDGSHRHSLKAGWHAVELAAKHRELVERLVLVATPPLEDEDAVELGAVEAKTLLLYGSRDGGQRQATWWKEHLGGRIEMVPTRGPRDPRAECGHAPSPMSRRERSARRSMVDSFAPADVAAFERDGFLVVEEGLVSERALELLRERYLPLFDGEYRPGTSRTR